MSDDYSGLTRAVHPMPDWIRNALVERGLMAAYQARPAYQRNDYIGWIVAAKREATRVKRMTRMLDELEAGGVYMNMQHPPSRG